MPLSCPQGIQLTASQSVEKPVGKPRFFSMAPGETSHPERGDPSISKVQQNQQNYYFWSIKMSELEIGFAIEKF